MSEKPRRSREQYLADQARRREQIRSAHYDDGLTWREVGAIFKIDKSTARQLAMRARREREEEAERVQPPLFELTA